MYATSCGPSASTFTTRAGSSSANTALHTMPSANVTSADRASFSRPSFFGNCFGLISRSLTSSAILGRKATEFSPPCAAIVFATFEWNLTAHGRASGAAVSLDVSADCLVDGFEDGSRVDKLVLAASQTCGEFAIVDAIVARCNEKVGDGGTEDIGDSLNDFNPDVDGATFDSGYGGPRYPSALGEFFLREAGSRPPDDDIDT